MKPWNATIRPSAPFTAEVFPFARLATPWITFFEEISPRREAAGDLYFEPTDQPRPVAAPRRIVVVPIEFPLELVALVGFGCIGLAVVVRRSRARAASR